MCCNLIFFLLAGRLGQGHSRKFLARVGIQTCSQPAAHHLQDGSRKQGFENKLRDRAWKCAFRLQALNDKIGQGGRITAVNLGAAACSTQSCACFWQMLHPTSKFFHFFFFFFFKGEATRVTHVEAWISFTEWTACFKTSAREEFTPQFEMFGTHGSIRL